MAKGMAAERVAGQEDDVREHEHTAETNAEMPSEIERQDRIEPEETQLNDCRVEGKSVAIAEHPGKGRFTVVAALRFRHRARSRVPEERPEVRLSVVVATQPEREWRPRHPDARRDRPDLDQRGKERAEVKRVVALVLEE